MAPVSQKVVNRKLGRTTVFTIYDRFTKFTDIDIRHFLVANYRLGGSSRKSLKTNVEWYDLCGNCNTSIDLKIIHIVKGDKFYFGYEKNSNSNSLLAIVGQITDWVGAVVNR
jgi:hypothetical protein